MNFEVKNIALPGHTASLIGVHQYEPNVNNPTNLQYLCPFFH